MGFEQQDFMSSNLLKSTSFVSKGGRAWPSIVEMCLKIKCKQLDLPNH